MADQITIFHILGYWALALFCAGILLGMTWYVLGGLVSPVWYRLTRVYDIYVLNWWIHEIKASGHTIPTKANVQDLVARVHEIAKMDEEADRHNDGYEDPHADKAA